MRSFLRLLTRLLFQVFHKLITTGNQRLQSLFDCLLTIIVNGKTFLCVSVDRVPTWACFSIALPKVDVDGGGKQTRPFIGSVFNAVVPVCFTKQPSFGILPAGSIQ